MKRLLIRNDLVGKTRYFYQQSCHFAIIEYSKVSTEHGIKRQSAPPTWFFDGYGRLTFEIVSCH